MRGSFMKVLYIDTSSSYLYTGIVEDNKLLTEKKEKLDQKLSILALPKIEEMFNELKLLPKQIDKIIVVNGPGSFTGIRVGLTIAKVYAWSLEIPITTITSLEAMATSCQQKGILVPMIDARRDYSYAAIYDQEKLILDPCHISNSQLEKILKDNEQYIIISNDEISLNAKKCNYNPNILKIVEKYRDKEEINPHLINPKYLKLTEAEESKLSS